MSLLPSMLLYMAIGCGEWYLALRRTLACARGEKTVLVCIVFIENLLGLWVLSTFIRSNNWLVAVVYSAGASAGALLVAMKSDGKEAEGGNGAQTCQPQQYKKKPVQSLVSAVLEYVAKVWAHRPRLSFFHRGLRRAEHAG